MHALAPTPAPPYYAVIFSSFRTDRDVGYVALAQRMLSLAEQQRGFLGYEGVRDGTAGIAVSYWESLDAIAAWRRHAEHRQAQTDAQLWYAAAYIRVCRVERSYPGTHANPTIHFTWPPA